MTAAANKHYANNKGYYYDRNLRRRMAFTRIIVEAKNVPCMDCGQSYPSYVMDFDHRDPSTKKFDIAKVYKISSEQKLRDEIAKCDVVCSNCHRIRTHGDLTVSHVDGILV